MQATIQWVPCPGWIPKEGRGLSHSARRKSIFQTIRWSRLLTRYGQPRNFPSQDSCRNALIGANYHRIVRRGVVALLYRRASVDPPRSRQHRDLDCLRPRPQAARSELRAGAIAARRKAARPSRLSASRHIRVTPPVAVHAARDGTPLRAWACAAPDLAAPSLVRRRSNGRAWVVLVRHISIWYASDRGESRVFPGLLEVTFRGGSFGTATASFFSLPQPVAHAAHMLHRTEIACECACRAEPDGRTVNGETLRHSINKWQPARIDGRGVPCADASNADKLLDGRHVTSPCARG